MSRHDREETVASLNAQLQRARAMYVFDYTGLNVDKITSLRRDIRGVGSEVKVAKNTLLKIAVKNTAFEPLCEHFVGQTAVAFIEGDPAQAAKTLTRFYNDAKKENPDLRFTIRAGVLENTLLSATQINQIGDLPGRDVLLAQLVGMLAAPIAGFVSVLSDIPRKFLRVLAAVAEQKEGK
ncbi:MAG: 50S ribosomal protein L10 [Deltaproteobacteria bacterium]|nr:50S ribosomal protein L10 [Deltaproteobacteria bacterium]